MVSFPGFALFAQTLGGLDLSRCLHRSSAPAESPTVPPQGVTWNGSPRPFWHLKFGRFLVRSLHPPLCVFLGVMIPFQELEVWEIDLFVPSCPRPSG